jgi:hypothetical protein
MSITKDGKYKGQCYKIPTVRGSSINFLIAIHFMYLHAIYYSGVLVEAETA